MPTWANVDASPSPQTRPGTQPRPGRWFSCTLVQLKHPTVGNQALVKLKLDGQTICDVGWRLKGEGSSAELQPWLTSPWDSVRTRGFFYLGSAIGRQHTAGRWQQGVRLPAVRDRPTTALDAQLKGTQLVLVDADFWVTPSTWRANACEFPCMHLGHAVACMHGQCSMASKPCQ